jgi:hypothetical protein
MAWPFTTPWYAVLVTKSPLRGGMRSWAGPRRMSSYQAQEWKFDMMELYWEDVVTLYRYDDATKRWVIS